MEKSIDSYFTEILGVTYTNPREYSPLCLAYIGDSVFDLLIKTLAVTKDNKQAYKYHKEVSQKVKAEAQAGYMDFSPMMKSGYTREEEIQRHIPQPRMPRWGSTVWRPDLSAL